VLTRCLTNQNCCNLLAEKASGFKSAQFLIVPPHDSVRESIREKPVTDNGVSQPLRSKAMLIITNEIFIIRDNVTRLEVISPGILAIRVAGGLFGQERCSEIER
jgi:hypothetical protein